MHNWPQSIFCMQVLYRAVNPISSFAERYFSVLVQLLIFFCNNANPIHPQNVCVTGDQWWYNSPPRLDSPVSYIWQSMIMPDQLTILSQCGYSVSYIRMTRHDHIIMRIRHWLYLQPIWFQGSCRRVIYRLSCMPHFLFTSFMPLEQLLGWTIYLTFMQCLICIHGIDFMSLECSVLCL